MKTQIIQLEPHDDIISARDKMGWGKAERILLVWPERGKTLNRKLDLRLLKRHSDNLGAQLAIVARDPDVCYQSPRLGIPVFNSLRHAQSASWKLPRKFRNMQAAKIKIQPGRSEQNKLQSLDRPTHRGEAQKETRLNHLIRLSAFILGVLAMLSMAATLAPGAEIIITPQEQWQEITLEVLAKPEFTAPGLSGALPSQTLNIVVEGRESIPVSGVIVIPDQPAIGEVTFTNLTDQTVSIPEGTIVLNQDDETMRYVVIQAGEVEAGPGTTITLPIRCLTPGIQGNLPAESIVAIEGLLGTQLRVVNAEPTHTGSDRQEPAPTGFDRQKIYAELIASLQVSAISELQNTLEAGDVLIPNSLTLVEVLEETYQPSEIEPADQLSLNLRLEYRGLFVSTHDIQILANALLDANVTSGYEPVENSLEIEHLSAPQPGEKYSASWELRARRKIQAIIDISQVQRLSLGLAPNVAQDRLNDDLPLALPPQILISPAWWPRLPVLPFRIMITTRESDYQSAIGK